LSLKELTNISHLLINRNRFKSFLLLSTLIHLSIIIALPISVNKKSLAKPKSFKVDLIRKNPKMLTIDFSFRELEIFCKVVELESFSKAVEAVFLVQASVSERKAFKFT